MDDKMNHFLYGRPHAAGEHHISTEETIVKAICRRFGIPFRPLLWATLRETSVPGITLEAFAHRYPTFPVWPGYRNVGYQRDMFGSLYRRFDRTPSYKAWAEIYPTRPEPDFPVACFFTWPKFGRVVIHDCMDRTDDSAIVEEMFIRKRIKGHPRPFLIEPTKQFLERLDWEPPTNASEPE